MDAITRVMLKTEETRACVREILRGAPPVEHFAPGDMDIVCDIVAHAVQSGLDLIAEHCARGGLVLNSDAAYASLQPTTMAVMKMALEHAIHAMVAASAEAIMRDHGDDVIESLLREIAEAHARKAAEDEAAAKRSMN